MKHLLVLLLPLSFSHTIRGMILSTPEQTPMKGQINLNSLAMSEETLKLILTMRSHHTRDEFHTTTFEDSAFDEVGSPNGSYLNSSVGARSEESFYGAFEDSAYLEKTLEDSYGSEEEVNLRDQDEKEESILEVRDVQGRTALFRMVQQRDLERCRKFLDAGADVNASNDKDLTPLHCAAARGYEDILALLLGRGADCTAQTATGWTPLHFASWRGHEEVAALLLIQEQSVLAMTCLAGNTALHGATWMNHPGISKLLIFCGADLTARNRVGATPFHYAAYRGNEEIIRLIVSEIDCDIETAMGNTPLHCASWRGHAHLVPLLIEHGASHMLNKRGESPLHCAAFKGHKNVLEVLIACGALESTLELNTLLHSAVRGNRVEIIQYLLTVAAVAKDGIDDQGMTALDLATHLGYADVLQALERASLSV